KLRIAWYGDRLLFASDTPGPGAALTDRATANLWSVAADGSDLRSHTSLSSAEGYLREPATDGSSIVFSSRGRLFAMDSLEATPREVEVLVSGVGAARVPRPASPSENLLAMRPLHDARASVVEWRGSVHALTHRGGRVGRLLHALPAADGSKIAPSTHDTVVRLVTLRGLEDPAKVSQHAPAADPAASAWEQDAEHAVAAPRLDHVREVGRSSGGEVRDLAWSPDGRWLVWAEPNSWQLSRLMISDTDDPEPTGRALTTGKFQDSAPAFSADGKHLALLSLRTFETVYDDM